MKRRLTNQNHGSNTPSKLTDNRTKTKFKISIERKLDNKFCFGCLKENEIKLFNKFVNETVGKELTISEVETLFKRKRGNKYTMKINDKKFEIVHFGKDRSPFRIFGYYYKGYFVITRIDPKHSTHKE